MAGPSAKFRLKRRKVSAEEFPSKAPTPRSTDTTAPVSRGAGTDRPEVPGSAWWSPTRGPAVESLWAFALHSSLPDLEDQHWEALTDLPLPQPVASQTSAVDRCDLGAAVPPLPDAAPRPGPSPPPIVPVVDLHGERTCSQIRDPTVGPRTPPSAGTASTDRRNGLSDTERGGAVPEAVSHEEREEERDGGHGGRNVPACRGSPTGGGGLQSCPMCLRGFPPGWTQMECDGHLAQCLSTMNVEMTW